MVRLEALPAVVAIGDCRRLTAGLAVPGQHVQVGVAFAALFADVGRCRRAARGRVVWGFGRFPTLADGAGVMPHPSMHTTTTRATRIKNSHDGRDHRASHAYHDLPR